MSDAAANPAVSVIVPYHNEGALLLQAIESIAAQTYAGGIEIIVVDDGSHIPPPLPARAERHIVVLRNETSQYASAARNRGIAAASGKYVAFLDADDVYYPARIADQVAFLEAHPEVIFVGGKTRVHRPPGVEESYNFVHRFYPELVDTAAILPSSASANCCAEYMFCTGAFTTTRQALLDVGGFDESLRWGEEWDLQVRLAQLGPIATVPQLAMDYLCREGSVCSTLNPEKFRSAARLCARWRRTVPGLPAAVRRQLRRDEHNWYLLAAQIFLEERQEPRPALACALRSWQSGGSLWSLRSTLRMALHSARGLALRS